MWSFRFLAALAILAVLSAARLAVPTGLRAQYFLGPAFEAPAVHTTVDATFSAESLSRTWGFRPPEAFSVHWSGFVFVDRPGLYTFTVTADDGSSLFVDRAPVIEERGQGPGVRSGRMPLERGAHAVALQYVQRGGAYQLDWTWALDDESPVAVPAWSLSTRPRGRAAALAMSWLPAAWWTAFAAALVLGARRLRRPRDRAAGERRDAFEPVPAAGAYGWWRFGLPCLVLFAAFAVVQTWPLATDPAHLSRNDNADTVLNEWILAWVAHQLPSDPWRLFDANIFHPERRTLAYSEPLILQSVLGAPVAWLGGSPVLVYNLVLLAGFTLTGWAMAMVVTRWTGDRMAGIVAGVLIAFNAHTLTRLPHLQAQHAEFLPLALLSLDALLRGPRWSPAIWLAAWFTLQALASIHLLVFTTVALAIAVIVRPEDWLGAPFRRVAPRLALAAAIAGAVLVPVLLPYWANRAQGFERSIDEVAWFSAKGVDYWSTPSRLHGWLGTSAAGATSLFPGAMALALASAALFARNGGWTDRRLRMCLAAGLAGLVLSFGPVVPGYVTLYSSLPLLQAVRASARFGYLALVAVAVAAGFGVAFLRLQLADRPRLKHVLSAAVLALVFLEPLAAPITYQPFTGIPEIYRRLESQSGAVAADLPFPPPEAIHRNAPFMLGSTLHFKPILNGYSGFVPPGYVARYAALANFPHARSVEALRGLGVTHVFVHRDRLDKDALAAVARHPALREMAVDGQIALYRVMAGDEGL